MGNYRLLLALGIAVGAAVLVISSSTAGPAVGLNRMLAGGRMLEVVDTRQLTLRSEGFCQQVWLSPNGKYVACRMGQDGDELRIIDVNSRRNVMSLDRKFYYDAVNLKTRLTQPIWALSYCVRYFFWLSDSQSFVTELLRLAPNEDQPPTNEQYVVVMNIKGQVATSIAVPSDGVIDQLAINPAGTCLMYNLGTPPQDQAKTLRQKDVIIWNLTTGATTTVYSQAGGWLDVMGWSPEGDAVICRTPESAKTKRAASINVSDKKQTLVDATPWMRNAESPDGGFLAKEDYGKSITIQTKATGKTVRKVEVPAVSFGSWIRNTKMFTYWTRTDMSDETKSRGTPICQLWLSSLESGKLNHLCVAAHADPPLPDGGPTWSSGLTRVAYTIEGQVYISELKWSDLTVDDKLLVGIPLAEEEIKNRVTNNAKEIGVAFVMYTGDWDGAYPPGDDISKELYPYMRNKDLMLLPGGDKNIFTYHHQANMKDITHRADTVIGEMDAGYSWMIQLFADGHVAVRPK